MRGSKPQLSTVQHRHQHNFSVKLRSSSSPCFQPLIRLRSIIAQPCAGAGKRRSPMTSHPSSSHYSPFGHVKGQDLSAYRCGKEIGGKCDVGGCGWRVHWDTCCDSDSRRSSRGNVYMCVRTVLRFWIHSSHHNSLQDSYNNFYLYHKRPSQF